jgi:prepilin-type N-terminal cleavage/methylation domain-containing protein
MARRQNGYTLVEMIVVMAIFTFVIMITGNVFNNMLNSTKRTSKSVETQITDIIGLELMRVDIKHAGYGLPYYFPPAPAIFYSEAPDNADDPVTGVNRKDYNDAPTNPPRPFRLGNNAGINLSDYLVVKSTLLGAGVTAQKWNYMSTGGTLKTWDVAAENLLTAGEKVIVVDLAPNSPPDQQRQLITSGGHFYAKYNSGDTYDLTNYYPTENNQTYVIYGIADATIPPRMPFNRADYYIRIPAGSSMPQRCAPGTGILYKATLDQASGTFTEIPLLDCVGDMQLVFGLATNAPLDNNVILHEDTNNLNTGMSLYDLARQVKEVRLYVLTHEGGMKPNYTYLANANAINVGEDFGGGMKGNTWIADGTNADLHMGKFGANWQHYFWKVLTVVIKPNNL